MGRPPAIEDGEIKQLLKERDKIALTTGEIADELDVHRKTAHSRLKKLEGDTVECDEMSQADAWYLAQDDPCVVVDGGSRYRMVIRNILNISAILAISFLIWAGLTRFANFGGLSEWFLILAATTVLVIRALYLVYNSAIPETVEAWVLNRRYNRYVRRVWE